jgi:hypothetical protein
MSRYRLFRRRKADADLQEELHSFLSEEIAENLARDGRAGRCWPP